MLHIWIFMDKCIMCLNFNNSLNDEYIIINNTFILYYIVLYIIKILHRIYRKLVFLSAYIHLTINSSLLCCIFRIMYQLHCQSFINSVSIWALKGTDLNSMKTLAQLPEKEKENQVVGWLLPTGLVFSTGAVDRADSDPRY